LSIVVRSMKETDLKFAMELANQEDWDYDLKDITRLRSLFPSGCFVAEYMGARVGWVVACTYVSLAWVSSLVVRDDLRGKGIGAALVDRLVEYAHDFGIRTVGLYSYRDTVGFYERMGFRQDCEFEHLEGSSRGTNNTTVSQHVTDLKQVTEFDREYFHGNRESLLKLLHQEYPDLLLKSQGAHMSGYIAGKMFSDNSAEIGPWVCYPTRTLVAEQLFASELGQLRSSKIGITIPSGNSNAHRIVEKHGFKVEHRILRMFQGNAEDLPSIKGIYATAGLDVG